MSGSFPTDPEAFRTGLPEKAGPTHNKTMYYKIEDKFNALLRHMREGLPIETCLSLSDMTMDQYRAMNHIPEARQQMVTAMAEKERIVLDSIISAAVNGNTDAGRWYLERRSGKAYMTEAQKTALSLQIDRWRMEKKIIRAELEADPHRVASKPGRKSKPKAIEEKTDDIEPLEIEFEPGSESEED